jgi:hypothetical protein
VVTAHILIQTEVGKAAQVAKDIVDITGVQQAEAVAGPFDMVVRAEARDIDQLGKLVVAARAGDRRHHQDPHLPGGAPLELRDQTCSTARVPARRRTGAQGKPVAAG